jgi:hypothetical protein
MSKSIYQIFATNTTNESEGIWIRFVLGDDTFEVRVARAGGSNPRFGKAVEKHTRALRRAGLKIEKLNMDQHRTLNRNIFTDACILDWRGDAFKEPDGTPIPFNRENALRIFQALPEFFEYIVAECQSLENFKDEEREEESKNLSQS